MSNSNQKSWSEMSKAERIISLIVGAVIVFLAVSISTSLFGGKNSSDSMENGQRKYGATATTKKVDSPATLIVAFDVTNNTDKVGEPFCSVSAKDSASSYKGLANKQMPPINPGETKGGYVSMTVTNQGAAYVNIVTVTCTD